MPDSLPLLISISILNGIHNNYIFKNRIGLLIKDMFIENKGLGIKH